MPDQQPPDHRDDELSPGETLRRTGKALLGRDLIAPGPGWPVGKRARARRDKREQIRRTAAERRRALRQSWASTSGTDRSDPAATQWRPVPPRRNAAVVTGMGGLVCAVAVLSIVATRCGRDEQPTPQPAAAPPVPSTSAPAPSPGPVPPGEANPELGPVEPIPPGGVAAIVPSPRPRLDPGSVHTTDVPIGPPRAAELAAPDTAAAAWLARWCGFDSREPYGAAENRARGMMTATGWSEFSPSPQGRASWDKTVAAGESARCSAPHAEINPAAPHTETSAIVLVSAQRVVTGHDGQYVERLDEQRIMQRGRDGTWLVDTATQGG